MTWFGDRAMANAYPLMREKDYDRALAEIEKHFDSVPAPGSPEAARFDLLSELTDAYERKHWPIEAPAVR